MLQTFEFKCSSQYLDLTMNSRQYNMHLFSRRRMLLDLNQRYQSIIVNGLNNSAARAKVTPRSMQRLLVFRKVDTRWQFKVFWYQLLAYPKISLRLLLLVTKSFRDNAIALYASCVCSLLAAMLRNFSRRFAWKVRGIIPPEFKTEGIDPLYPPVSDAYDEFLVRVSWA